MKKEPNQPARANGPKRPWLILNVRQKMKTPIICALSACALSLTGCLPFPHSEVRFFEMKGRVVDADTLKPISGARVAIHDAPSVSTKTDEDGRFDVERQRNYYVGVIIHQDVPLGSEKHWSQIIDVS